MTQPTKLCAIGRGVVNDMFPGWHEECPHVAFWTLVLTPESTTGVMIRDDYEGTDFPRHPSWRIRLCSPHATHYRGQPLYIPISTGVAR